MRVGWRRENQGYLPFAGSVPRWLQQLGLGQAEIRGQEVYSCLHRNGSAPVGGLSVTAFPGLLAGSKDLNQHTNVECSPPKWQLGARAVLHWMKLLLMWQGQQQRTAQRKFGRSSWLLALVWSNPGCWGHLWIEDQFPHSINPLSLTKTFP